MPSVSSPSDGGYNYYQKTLNDLEEELKSEAKRANQRREEEIQSLQENHKNTLAKRERETEETIRKMRESSQDAISRDRDYSKAEIERLKNNTYDKYGRYNGLEADALKQTFENYKNAAELTEAQAKRDLDSAEKAYHERLAETRSDHADEMEKAIRAARDSAHESYSTAYQGQKKEYDKFKDETAKQYDEMTRTHAEEIDTERRRTEAAIRDAQKEYERKMRKNDDTSKDRLDKIETAYTDRLEQAARNQALGREQETRDLRKQLDELIETEKQYRKEKGQGRQEAIDELEREFRTRERVLTEGFDRQIGQLKHQAKESDRYFNYLNNRNLRDKDVYFTNLIAKVNLENRNEEKDLENTFNKDRGQMELQLRRDREQSRRTLESQLHEANVQRDKSLEQQAKSYQDTIARQRANDQEKINSLQKELNYRSTSEDASVISPAAEAAVRKTVIGDYEKTFKAERARNDRTVDSMQRSYIDKVQDTLHDKETNETNIRKQNAVDRELERNRLLSHISDTEFMTQEAIRNKEYEHTQQSENLHRNYANMLERQRREYEDVLQAIKNESSYKLVAQRQESEFAAKMTHRSFTAQQNELIREYNKRLAEQKVEYETKLEEVKGQAQQTVRESERRAKLALEEQARSFEQRISQAEYQYKERERYLTQNFQDQMEKVKRSNALLSTKKG